MTMGNSGSSRATGGGAGIAQDLESGGVRNLGPGDPGQRLGGSLRSAFLLAVNHDAREQTEWGIAQGFAMLDLFAIEALEVVLHDRCDRIMVGYEGLDHDSPGARRPPRATGNLSEQLEGAFGGPKVGHVEAKIRSDHADQLNAREIMALGDHLRADHDVDRFVPESQQDRLRLAALASDVAIESHYTGARK